MVDQVKVWLGSIAALTTAELASSQTLEYIVLILSIIYTIYKMYLESKKDNRKDKPDAWAIKRKF